ncbi:MAG: hypothetical protein HY088_04885 [Ignavibacteriales bacterium]|nr:hypothetical protein [Ignavibacteriales bacterium]
MSMGQTMITAAFLALLIASAINVNRMLVESAQSGYEAEAYDLAVGIAQDLLVEATSKKFDENATTTPGVTQSTSAFSTTMGPDGTEKSNIVPWPDSSSTNAFKSKMYYTDVDDYNGYQRTVDTKTISGFKVSAEVYYVTGTNLDIKTTSRTYFKRIDVYVGHSLYLVRKNVPADDPRYFQAVTYSRLKTY